MTTSGAISTTGGIVSGAAVYIYLGVRQLTLRVRKLKPLTEHGVLVAAAFFGALASVPHIARSIEVPIVLAVVGAFGTLAAIRGIQGHRLVGSIDRPKAKQVAPDSS